MIDHNNTPLTTQDNTPPLTLTTQNTVLVEINDDTIMVTLSSYGGESWRMARLNRLLGAVAADLGVTCYGELFTKHKIMNFHDHKGTLTVTHYGITLPYIVTSTISDAWEMNGELKDQVEFVSVPLSRYLKSI